MNIIREINEKLKAIDWVCCILNRHRRPLAMAFSLCLLTGCAPHPKIQRHGAVRPDVIGVKWPTWQMNGQLTVTQGTRIQRARVVWRQRGGDYDLYFMPKIGPVMAHLSRRHNQVVWQQGQRRQTAASAAALLMAQTGWQLPIDTLPTLLLESQSRCSQPKALYPIVQAFGLARLERSDFQWVGSRCLAHRLRFTLDDQTSDLVITRWSGLPR